MSIYEALRNIKITEEDLEDCYKNFKHLSKPKSDIARKLEEVLEEVKRGQHLRFFSNGYKTKNVCLAAVLYESSHNSYMLHDLHSVLYKHFKYVVENVKKYNKDDFYLKQLEKSSKDYLENKNKEMLEGVEEHLKEHKKVPTFEDTNLSYVYWYQEHKDDENVKELVNKYSEESEELPEEGSEKLNEEGIIESELIENEDRMGNYLRNVIKNTLKQV
jgi:hypothetical protein